MDRSIGRWLVWMAGVALSTPMSASVLIELFAHGARANPGWGVLGLLTLQPLGTLLVLVGAALVWEAARFAAS